MPGLYLHIPFCEHKCLYCDFYSLAPDEERSRLGDYSPRFVRSLLEEIRIVHADVGKAVPRFDTVFFGGGTPSLLDAQEMSSIVGLLRSRFDIAPDAEWTLEANPGTVRYEKLAEFCAMGFNRISFGVQSFNASELNFLTRIHSPDEAKIAVREARRAGFTNVSIDLMFNIPGQTDSTWSETLGEALALDTDHLSCYSLTVERNTPLARLVETGRVRMPDGSSDESLYATTIDRLTAAGYEQYEVSNFAKPGMRSRHNLNYWKHGEYLGFGPSAHSYLSGVRRWNIANLSSYEAAIVSGNLPIAGEERLSSEQLMSEFLFLGLRSEGLDLKRFVDRFGSDVWLENKVRIETMVEQGLATLTGTVLSLTSRGYMVCDEICASLRS